MFPGFGEAETGVHAGESPPDAVRPGVDLGRIPLRCGFQMSTTTLFDRSEARGDEGRWAVETHGLTKRFGANVAVNGVELLVPRGCAFGYLGPNGAGKTTLIRVLLGLTHADA